MPTSKKTDAKDSKTDSKSNPDSKENLQTSKDSGPSSKKPSQSSKEGENGKNEARQKNGTGAANSKAHPTENGHPESGPDSGVGTPYRDRDISFGPMGAVKQATLLNYHLAIEDSVDIDKIWDDMQSVFSDDEQEEIQTQGNKKAELKRLLDILPHKDDRAFDTLVQALRPEYKWLSVRLQQGVEDEEKRVNKMGRGVRRKIALALLTARISERQKDGILDRVTSVVEEEMMHKTHRVSIPDHRTEALLEREHQELQTIIRDEIDPLLYGDEAISARDSYNYDDDSSLNTIDRLREKLEELQVLKECYAALSISHSTTSRLPTLLLQKIDEVKTDIKILRKEKQEAQAEADRQREASLERQRAVSTLEERNRGLEMDMQTLESERQWLEEKLRKYQDNKKDAEREYNRAEEENRKLKGELQLALDKVSDLSLRNRSLDDHNEKLTRDNYKLSNSNSQLRHEARNNFDGVGMVAEMRANNKKLTTDRQQLKRDVQRAENERRQLIIKTHKLEAENRNLREQKRRLLLERRRSTEENRALKREAQLLTISRYHPLPPITEIRRESYGSGNDVNEDDVSRASQRLGHGSREIVRRSERETRAVTRSYERPSGRQPQRKTRSPWNKYRPDAKKKTLPRGRGDVSERRNRRTNEEKEETGQGDGEEKKAPSYMKPTTSSKKHEYLEDEVPIPRASQSPRRAAAWK